MIDANQQRFRMLARENHFALEERRNTLEWNNAKHVLRFRSSRTVDELPVDRPRARELAGQMPLEHGPGSMRRGVPSKPAVYCRIPSSCFLCRPAKKLSTWP